MSDYINQLRTLNLWPVLERPHFRVLHLRLPNIHSKLFSTDDVFFFLPKDSAVDSAVDSVVDSAVALALLSLVVVADSVMVPLVAVMPELL